MNIQIGQVNIKIAVHAIAGKGRIEIVSPMLDFMFRLDIDIDTNKKDEPVTFSTLTYERGDKDAEKSAIS